MRSSQNFSFGQRELPGCLQWAQLASATNWAVNNWDVLVGPHPLPPPALPSPRPPLPPPPVETRAARARRESLQNQQQQQQQAAGGCLKGMLHGTLQCAVCHQSPADNIAGPVPCAQGSTCCCRRLLLCNEQVSIFRKH